MIQIFREAIRAGAKVINVPDTTGYAIPSEFGALIANLIERTAGADRVIWSAHCHNDLGLAVANSLAAVHNGARQLAEFPESVKQAAIADRIVLTKTELGEVGSAAQLLFPGRALRLAPALTRPRPCASARSGPDRRQSRRAGRAWRT